MKKILNLLMVVSLMVNLISCTNTDEFLNKEPLGEFAETAVWSDPALVETFVNSMYRNGLGFPFSIERLSDFSDESHFTPDWGVADFNKGLITSDAIPGWDGLSWVNSLHTKHFRWDPLYANVRRANVFFAKIGEAEGDENVINNLKGQAYFLRAWTYFYLTNLYGGVPIITKVYGLNDEFKVPRNSYDDCIKFIVGQADSAAMYLEGSYPTDGRISEGAALALKSRVLLYAASDLHNPAKNGVVTSGFANPELLGYTSGDATARWTAAKDAAKAVIDLNKYSLYKAIPAAGDSIAQNFVEFFTSSGTSEDILLQFFSPKTNEDWEGYNPGLYVGPNGYHNWGNNCPLGDLVDDYEMKDGSKFDWENPIHKANPYQNRDARLYATVLYEGVQWRERPADGLKLDPLSKIQVGLIYNTAGKLLKAGVDTRRSTIENWNGTYTGYYTRKWVDPSVDPQYVKQTVPFKHIRYGEILLNYAEACIELGDEAEARTYINMIRTRAGQPELSASVSGDALKQAYRHERRIEFTYEDQRFWDIRRWIIGESAYYQTSGIDVRYITETTTDENDLTRLFLPPAKYTGTRKDLYRQPNDATWGDPVYKKVNVGGDARAWNNKCYFFPIMRSEMNKNDQLIQNPGY